MSERGVVISRSDAQTLAVLPDVVNGEATICVVADEAQAKLMSDPAVLPRLAEVVRDGDIGAVVLTSGSTGTPKCALLSRSALAAAVELNARRTDDICAQWRSRGFGYGGDAGRERGLTWHLALPTVYVAGLMVGVRAFAAGGAVAHCGSDLTGLSVRPGRNFISLVPTQLYRALSNPMLVEQLRRCDAVLLGGGAASADLLARAEAARIPVVTTYGMTETCGGVVYNGVPFDQVEVECAPDTGWVALLTPTAFSGYFDCASGEVVGVPHNLGDGRSRVVTTDLGVIENGRVTITGRADDIVKSGGIKINMATVQQVAEDVLARHGGQYRVCVVAIEDAQWGSALALATDAPMTVQWWKTALTSQDAGLDRRWVPRHFMTDTPIPLLVTGKIDRQAVRRLWLGMAPDETESSPA